MIFEVAFSPDGRRLASAGGDGTVKVWDVETGDQLLTLQGPQRLGPRRRLQPRRPARSPRPAAAGSSSSGTPRPAPSLLTLCGHAGIVYGVAFSPDGRTLATAGGDGIVKLWDLADRPRAARRCRPTPTRSTASPFSPDGRPLATAGGDGTVRLWDAATGAEVAALRGHPDAVFGVAFSPDGRTPRLGRRGGDRQALGRGHAAASC